MNATPAKLAFNCVEIPDGDAEALIDMIDGERDITRKTFLRHVDREQMADLEESLGYASHPSAGLTMAADWHVTYHKGTYKGRRAYWLCWSHIEFVFIKEACQ